MDADLTAATEHAHAHLVNHGFVGLPGGAGWNGLALTSDYVTGKDVYTEVRRAVNAPAWTEEYADRLLAALRALPQARRNVSVRRHQFTVIWTPERLARRYGPGELSTLLVALTEAEGRLFSPRAGKAAIDTGYLDALNDVRNRLRNLRGAVADTIAANN